MAHETDTTDDRIARLRRIDTCAVSVALDMLGLGDVVTGLLQGPNAGIAERTWYRDWHRHSTSPLELISRSQCASRSRIMQRAKCKKRALGTTLPANPSLVNGCVELKRSRIDGSSRSLTYR